MQLSEEEPAWQKEQLSQGLSGAQRPSRCSKGMCGWRKGNDMRIAEEFPKEIGNRWDTGARLSTITVSYPLLFWSQGLSTCWFREGKAQSSPAKMCFRLLLPDPVLRRVVMDKRLRITILGEAAQHPHPQYSSFFPLSFSFKDLLVAQEQRWLRTDYQNIWLKRWPFSSPHNPRP